MTPNKSVSAERARARESLDYLMMVGTFASTDAMVGHHVGKLRAFIDKAGEPVAWMIERPNSEPHLMLAKHADAEFIELINRDPKRKAIALYTSPQAAALSGRFSARDEAAGLVGELRAAIDEDTSLRDHIGGCTDGGCVIKRPQGMHTNGGCRCSDDRLKARRMMQWSWQLRTKLLAIINRGGKA